MNAQAKYVWRNLNFDNYQGDIMCVLRTGIAVLLALGLGSVPVVGQTPMNPPALGGMPLGLKAPTDRAVDYPAASLEAGFNEGLAQKLYAFRILEGGEFNINIRGQYAPEERARIHTTIHDLYLIRSGEGELTTGGELVDPTTSGAAGVELSGSSIRNGLTRVVRQGDMVFVPAGVPHQVTKSNGRLQFMLVRWFLHE